MKTVFYFTKWYFTTALIDGVYMAGNYSWNIFRVFSVRALLRTLFTPYKRIRDDLPSILDGGAFFEAIFGNFISRAIGFSMRLAVVIFALTAFLSVVIISAALLVCWLSLPFMLPYLIAESISHL